MKDAEVLAAILASHLRANISAYEGGINGAAIHWNRAYLDPGGVIFGPGPYAKVPITFPGDDPGWDIVVRVYPPERLRKRLAKTWERTA